MQGVKGMEKLLLCGVLAGDELNIINQQYVHLAVFFAECWRGFVADGVDQIVGELLGRDVENHFSLLNHLVADRVEDVGLAQSNAAIDKQRVVSPGGILRDSHACSLSQAICRAYHEVIKAIMRV